MCPAAHSISLSFSRVVGGALHPSLFSPEAVPLGSASAAVRMQNGSIVFSSFGCQMAATNLIGFIFLFTSYLFCFLLFSLLLFSFSLSLYFSAIILALAKLSSTYISFNRLFSLCETNTKGLLGSAFLFSRFLLHFCAPPLTKQTCTKRLPQPLTKR